MSQHSISAYDEPVIEQEDTDLGGHDKMNGVRVWCSLSTSTDWLHGAIKGSPSWSALRRHKLKHEKFRENLTGALAD